MGEGSETLLHLQLWYRYENIGGGAVSVLLGGKTIGLIWDIWKLRGLEDISEAVGYMALSSGERSQSDRMMLDLMIIKPVANTMSMTQLIPEK